MLWIFFFYWACVDLLIRGLHSAAFLWGLAYSSMNVVSTTIQDIWNKGDKKLWKAYNNGCNISWFSGGRWSYNDFYY